LYGRPKGRTNIQARDLKERIRLATAEAAKSYSIVRATARANNKPRAPKGELAQIVRTSKQKYGVDDVHISIETVRTRAQRHIFDPAVAQGTPSAMLNIEPYIVETIAQLARMRSPINIKTGLQLANSIIEGTPLMLELIAWKTKHNIHSRRRCYSSSAVGKEAHQQEEQLEGTTTTAEPGHLGWGYWKGFMKRNGH
jgi:hypothetical protein